MMLSQDNNKNLIRSFFRFLGEGKIDQALALDDDNVKWWVQGHGTNGKPVMQAIWSQVFVSAPGPDAMKLTGFVAEGDRVSAEAESNIPLPDGRIYHNTFHILFEIHGDKIVSAREYFDTALAQATFGNA
jgi:hypothetical protein